MIKWVLIPVFKLKGIHVQSLVDRFLVVIILDANF